MIDPLDDLICRHLKIADGGRAIGFAPNLRVEVFVDLLSAMLVPSQGELIVEALAKGLPEVDQATSGIVAPKWGNPVLGYELAKALGLPLLLARDDRLFGRWFDGMLERERKWILVDDVASDGERLAELAERAQDEGIQISIARFVVMRREGDARVSLEAEKVPAEGLREWDDDELRQLQAEWLRR
jgi:adenine/guanine phosphoribosyltransferase-like PRPP-binding protein